MATPTAKPERTIDAHQVDPALAHELEDDPGGGEAAGEISACGVGPHVAAREEVDADRQDGAEDDARQVLADRGDARLPPLGRPGPAAGLRRRPRPPAPWRKGYRRHSEFRHVELLCDVPGPCAGVPARSRASSVAAVLAVAFVAGRSYVRRHWRLVRGHVITRGLLAVALPGRRPGTLVGPGHARGIEPGHGGPGAPSHVGGRRGRGDRRRPRRLARRAGGRAPVGVPLAPCRRRRARRGSCAWSAGCPAVRHAPTPFGARWPTSSAPPATCRRPRSVPAATPPRRRCGRSSTRPRDEVEIVSAALSRLRSSPSPADAGGRRGVGAGPRAEPAKLIGCPVPAGPAGQPARRGLPGRRGHLGLSDRGRLQRRGRTPQQLVGLGGHGQGRTIGPGL